MYAFPKGSLTKRWNGTLVRINPQQVWPDDDPFVLDNLDLFSFTPHELSTTRSPRGAMTRTEVEQASQAPGEKRAVKRAK